MDRHPLKYFDQRLIIEVGGINAQMVELISCGIYRVVPNGKRFVEFAKFACFDSEYDNVKIYSDDMSKQLHPRKWFWISVNTIDPIHFVVDDNLEDMRVREGIAFS